MVITYHCDNCGKNFKLREYMKLEILYTSDDRSVNMQIARGRKCDACGNEINIGHKIVT